MKKFKVITGFFWWWWYLISFIKGLQLKKEFAPITKYIFFIGYPRSGHSLIGALLDAHPNLLISNELNALHFFKKGYHRLQIFYFILWNSKGYGKMGRSNSNYNYQVPNQWQGKYDTLLGIGDKKGGKSSKILGEENKIDLLKKTERISQAQLKIIHVIRNPYDNVSTMILQQVKRNGKELSDELFENKMSLYLNKLKTNTKLKKQNPSIIFDVHLEDFILQPKKGLQEIFSFLEITTSEKYLDDCASIVWSKTNPSRFNNAIWTEDRKIKFSKQLEQYDFLKRYNF